MKHFLESGSKHVTKPGHMVPEAIWGCEDSSGLQSGDLGGSGHLPQTGRFSGDTSDSCTRATTAFLRRFLYDCLKHTDLLEMKRTHKQSPGRLNELQNVSTGSFWVNGASRHSRANKAAAVDGRADGT